MKKNFLPDEPANKEVFGLLLLVLLVGFGLRAWGIGFDLPDMGHGDEPEVINHAVRFGSGDLNPHRFQYGSLFQYLLFFLFGLFYIIGQISGFFSSVDQFALHFIEDPTIFYLIGRTLSALFGTATIALTYLIAKNIRNEKAGLAAALILTCCYQHAVHSHYTTVDVAMTFFFALAVYLSLRLFEKQTVRAYSLAGFATGLALATKFDGCFAGIALVTAHFLRKDQDSFRQKLVCKKLWLGIAFIFIGHFLASPYFYLELKNALVEIAELRAMHAFAGFNLTVYLKLLATSYWGYPLGIICIIGCLHTLLAGSRKGLVVFATVFAVLCFKSLHKYVEAKYILNILPLLAVGGGIVSAGCISRLRSRYVYFIIPFCLVQPLYEIAQWDYNHAQKSINLEAKEWIENHIPVNAKILLDNVGNAGPKLKNSPNNLKRQYQRALKNRLMKVEYLKLKLRATHRVYYNIVQIDNPGGFRDDDYSRYRLWQDLEEIGHPPDYYRKKGFDYIIITDRYFSRAAGKYRLIKEFQKGRNGIRIYTLQRRE